MNQPSIMQFFKIQQTTNVTPPPALEMTENVTLKRSRNKTKNGSTDAEAEDPESSSNGSAGDYEPGPWTCQECTFINDPCFEYECGACEAKRPKARRRSSQQAS